MVRKVCKADLAKRSKKNLEVLNEEKCGKEMLRMQDDHYEELMKSCGAGF